MLFFFYLQSYIQTSCNAVVAILQGGTDTKSNVVVNISAIVHLKHLENYNDV